MKREIAVALLFVAATGAACAESVNEKKPSRPASTAKRACASTVYLCTDENGNKEYRNTGITKGCKKINLPGLTTATSKRPPIQTEGTKFP